jgi:hypothetical protein
MILENKDSYKRIILSKAEMEHWEITVESDTDKRLLDILFDGKPIEQHKQGKKIGLEFLFLIVYGSNNLYDLLQNGFRTYEPHRNSKTKSK